MTGFDALRPLAVDLWTVDGALASGPLRLPSRMTVLRAAERLWIYSPCTISDALAEHLATLGTVAGIVAPNGYHQLFAAAAAARFDGAARFRSPALTHKTGLEGWQTLPNGALAESGGDIEALTIQGVPTIAETVLLHRPSRSLVVADLMFNVSSAPFVTRWLLRSTDSYGRPAVSRLWRWKTRDSAALGGSLETLARWDLDRIVVAHGDVIETGGRVAFAAALRHRFGPELARRFEPA